MSASVIETWHRLVRTGDVAGLRELVDEDAVMHSPVVHTPQRGRKLTVMYLAAAFQVLRNPTFRYVREIVGARDAMLEFETEIDGILVNGVDIIRWNDANRIVDFKVMLRPLKGVNIIHQKMGEMLAAAQKPAA